MTQRRIAFVTGGAGFIGSNIVAKLAEDRTLDVVVCDRLREAVERWLTAPTLTPAPAAAGASERDGPIDRAVVGIPECAC